MSINKNAADAKAAELAGKAKDSAKEKLNAGLATHNQSTPEITDAQKLELANKTSQEINLQLEQTLLINADLQNRIEELEFKLAQKGVIPVPVEAVKAPIPEKGFKVKFTTEDLVDPDDPKNKRDHSDKTGEYVFTIPKFSNPLAGHSVITAEEALTNKELLDHLVKEGFGGIKRKGAK
jgi:hypothetical protein